MSEDSGASLPPYVLDVSVIAAIARDDYDVMTLVQHLDARGRPLVIPVLAMTAAALDMRTDDTEAILHGLEQLGGAAVASLEDAEQAVKLATVIARTDLDPWDAHVAMVADTEVCSILTADAGKWRPHLSELAEPLHIIEIAEPE